MSKQKVETTAIVMGASIAGLWAARILSDHFDRVLVLERDRLPEQAEFRAGTPQARQYHVMLVRGVQIMDQFFPGMREELIDCGAIALDATRDVRVLLRGQCLEQFMSNQIMISCSRLLLEAAIRRRLRSLPKINFVERVKVLGLEMDVAHTRINGVRMRYLDDQPQQNSLEQVLYADLIIDTLGRRSLTPEWLKGLGYQKVQESVVDSFLGYVTRRYRKPDAGQHAWASPLLCSNAPHNPRSGLIFPEENQIWVLMIAGANKDYPPVDEVGFQEFAQSLGPEFHKIVTEGEAISKPYGYRGTDSRWRHYERLERWPDRFIVLGDAFCGFNPIYGQGMTVAALSVLALDTELRKAAGQLDGVAQRTIRSIARTTEGAWLLATGADLEWPNTIGGEKSNKPADRFARWYIGKLLGSMAHDRVLRLAFLEVNQLLQPVTSLFTPRMMLRVLRQTVLAKSN